MWSDELMAKIPVNKEKHDEPDSPAPPKDSFLELSERVNNDLAVCQMAYAQWQQLPFTQWLMQYAMNEATQIGQHVINTLDAKQQAEYLAMEKMADGTFFRNAYWKRIADIKAPFFAALNAQKSANESARGAGLGDVLPGNGIAQ